MSIIKKGALMLLLGSIGNSWAEVPHTVAFEEGEQFKFPLSKLNFNRVYVEGEKIVKLNLPENTFVIDKSDIQGSMGAESIYLKPLFDVPLTAFFTTDKGHHFSVTFDSDDSEGKTLRFVTKNTKLVKFIKPDISDVVLAEDILENMKSGTIPENYIDKKVVPKPFYVKKNIKVTLEKQYEGEEFTGYVYKLENKSKNLIPLSTSIFGNQKAEILSLSDDAISPHQIAYLYGLYRNEG